jgi:N-acetylglucosaminyldiphosphoundecaprenol N-acetyl-beta-D-mannosaminyltransferase
MHSGLLSSSENTADRCHILGIPVDGYTVTQLNETILRLVRERKRALVLNVNVHALNLSVERPSFADILRKAEVVFCDGAGVRMAAFLKGCRLPPRITYADWMWSLAEFSCRHELSIYFLGGRPGVAERARRVLCGAYPGLKIVGVEHGFFDKSANSDENAAIIRKVNKANADILIVGFGMPVQEEWLAANWPGLRVRVALTGGAAFDYISGTLRRPPRWMQLVGLEWLGRMLIEPRRLWRRYVVGNPLFIARLVTSIVMDSETALRRTIRARLTS